MRPPLELRLPVRSDGDDRELEEPALDRDPEPKVRTEVCGAPADLRRVHPRVERAAKPSLLVDDGGRPRRDDLIPEGLAGFVEVVAAEGRKSAHSVIPLIRDDRKGADRKRPEAADLGWDREEPGAPLRQLVEVGEVLDDRDAGAEEPAGVRAS